MTGHDRLECSKRCKLHRKQLGISGKVLQKRRTPKRHENTPENAEKPKTAKQPPHSVVWGSGLSAGKAYIVRIDESLGSYSR
ncbi:hypothetical protein S83_015306 [Arachis hypogaea]